MLVFKGKTFAQAYWISIKALMEMGQINNARGTTSKEFLDACLVVEDPSQCLYESSVRGSQFKYLAAEFLWYFLGRNDVDYISKHAKFWKQIQNADGTANSAYGNLIFTIKNQFGNSQYQWALNSLIADSNTRQAVMHFNMPRHQYADNKDFVCTMYANFHIRENKLHMSVFMRSNDAIWGTPTDVAFFCALQMQMLSHLKPTYPDLELGQYSHTANSYHIYDRHYDLAEKMIKSIFTPVKMPLVKTDLVDPTGRPTQDLVTAFKSLEEPTPDTTLIFQEKDDLLHWIYENYSTTTQSI
jgi:thymidylate synthase